MHTAGQAPRIVLILGSAPDAVASRSWERSPFRFIVAINNAWAIRTDWDYLIYPDDFPDDRLPTAQSPFASIVKSDEFVPAQNAFGGFVYAGGTMAFTAATSSFVPSRTSLRSCTRRGYLHEAFRPKSSLPDSAAIDDERSPTERKATTAVGAVRRR